VINYTTRKPEKTFRDDLRHVLARIWI